MYSAFKIVCFFGKKKNIYFTIAQSTELSEEPSVYIPVKLIVLQEELQPLTRYKEASTK